MKTNRIIFGALREPILRISLSGQQFSGFLSLWLQQVADL